ncbi:MAG: hypothetical protein RIQ53_3296 [Pseudomonadota bacterium]|jgi:hypothetical protein
MRAPTITWAWGMVPYPYITRFRRQPLRRLRGPRGRRRALVERTRGPAVVRVQWSAIRTPVPQALDDWGSWL